MSGEAGEGPPAPGATRRNRLIRTSGALGLGLIVAFGAFLVMDADGGGRVSGAASLTFLLAVPTAVCAMVSLIGDPEGDRGSSDFWITPVQTLLVTVLFGLVFLREGVICIVMLAPLWLFGGMVGTMMVVGLKKRLRERGRLFCAALLLLPVTMAQVEASMPVPVTHEVVAREVIVDAPPEAVWPLLVSIPAIGAGEGKWNVTQDLLGVPRPSEARLRVEIGRAVRAARWGNDVRFEEHIVRTEPGRALEWTFAFPDASVREHTDRHISPDGGQLRIASGGYRLEPLPGGRTRVRLETRYTLRTPLNAYAAWWGEWMLGDIQDNVLAIIEQRAEAAQRGGA